MKRSVFFRKVSFESLTGFERPDGNSIRFRKQEKEKKSLVKHFCAGLALSHSRRRVGAKKKKRGNNTSTSGLDLNFKQTLDGLLLTASQQTGRKRLA